MRFKKPESTGVVSVNMTPMIDMVFNLLIFFILTSQFVKLETEDVVLPVSTTAEPKDYTVYKNVVINVVKPEDPQIVVMHEALTSAELTELLRERKAELRPGEKMNVILRADQDIAFEHIARVMLAAGSAQIQGWWMQTALPEEKKGP